MHFSFEINPAEIVGPLSSGASGSPVGASRTAGLEGCDVTGRILKLEICTHSRLNS